MKRKQLIPLAVLLIIPLNAYAGKVRECNIALDKTATYLRSQSAITDKSDNMKSLSRCEIEEMISTAQNIINEGERIITLCDLDQEMTEGVVNLIIDNKTKLKQLANDVNGSSWPK